MNASFTGKKLLVVGGTSGMGFETAKLVLKNGGSVVLVGNRQDKAEQARRRWLQTVRFLSSLLT